MTENVFLGDVVSAFDFVKLLINSEKEDIEKDNGMGNKISNVYVLNINAVLFPHIFLSMSFYSKKEITLLQKCCGENRQVCLVFEKGEGVTAKVGCIASIIKIINNSDGGVQVLFHGEGKVKIKKTETTEEGFIIAEGEILKEKIIDENKVKNKAVISSVRELTTILANSHPTLPNEIKTFLTTTNNFYLLTYLLASGLDIPMNQKKKILEAADCISRGKILIDFLKKEIEFIKLKKEIYDKAQDRFAQRQRDYLIKEQINILKSKIGTSGKSQPSSQQDTIEEDEINELRKRGEKKEFSKEAALFFEKNLIKAEKMQNMSSDYMVLINQAEFMLSLPWLSYSNSKVDIKKAEKVLNSNHYGMEKVKERILEYLSVLKLTGHNVGGQILCLHGPCGVGKTSLCKDIAKALGRDYVKVALGGVCDEAEIRGHMKTYVGAMAGRILRSLQNLKHSDAVIVLDEIDKLDSKHGDPSAALLEVLDPNQNNSFVDHYLEVPYDLSKVIFIATANRLNTIAKPLRDRLEIIEVNGYALEEKVEIAKKYLIPTAIREHGLKKKDISFNDDAIELIIDKYTSESGVRELNRQIATTMRKVSRKIVAGEAYNKEITKDNLNVYLGCERYEKDIVEKMSRPGIAIGLAWTEVGGDILFIESTLMNGTGKLTLSGSLGDVMKESAQIAFIYLKSHYKEWDIPEGIFKKCDFHIHVPDGATPKDGPSAGITLFTTLLSLCTERKVKDNVAMTGEISLRGEVLPVGGIKEKVLAAKRAGIKKIIMCEKNKKDVGEIKKDYIKDIDFVFVQNVDEVIKEALC